jgi:hypothetical protein
MFHPTNNSYSTVYCSKGTFGSLLRTNQTRLIDYSKSTGFRIKAGLLAGFPHISRGFLLLLFGEFLLLLLADYSGSARHLYVVCIYGAICLQIQKYFPPDRAVFSSTNLILILFYVVSRFMEKISRFPVKICSKIQYDVLKIKFVDISHRRYKLRRDIE